MNPNFHPNVFWVKIRTRGSQASICVRIFTQFTTAFALKHEHLPPIMSTGKTVPGKSALHLVYFL